MTQSVAPPDALAGLLQDADGPVFSAPWQAQAFALVLALHERGVFTWPEWAAALTEAIRRAQAAGDPDLGSTYHQHWLDALEHLVLAKGLGDSRTLHALEHAWEAAALRTPHGEPIVLDPSDSARVLAATPAPATEPPAPAAPTDPGPPSRAA